jgi:hypothetical protein
MIRTVYVRPMPAVAMMAIAPADPAAAPEPPMAFEGQPEGAMGQAGDTKDDLFAGTEEFAKNASDVTEISMDPESLGMVGGSHANRAHSMVLNVVRTYTYDKPGMYDMAAVDRYRAKLNTGDWHCSVHTRDLKRGSSSDICNKRRTDGMRETAIITAEPRELTFIHTIRKENGGEGSGQGMGPISLNFGPAMAMLDAPEMAALAARLDTMRVHLDGLDVHIDADRMAEAGARLAEAQSRIAARMKDFNSQEFKDNVERMSRDMQRNMTQFNSPEFKERYERLGKEYKDYADKYKEKLKDEQRD